MRVLFLYPLKVLRAICLFPLCLSLTACLGPITPCFYVDSVQIKVDDNANDTSATEVDLVVAYEENLLKELLGLSANAYFEKSKQLQRDYPDKIAVFHWEVVPGQIHFADNLEYPASCPLGGVVYARYIAPGEHRIRIGSERNIEIHLKEDTFCLRSLGGSWLF